MLSPSPGSQKVGVLWIVGGLVVFLLGLLSWSQRKWGQLLIAANPPE
ncbi:hypothetical protein ACQEVC_17380 [Plantactinospora sp. CA-294935]